MKKEMKQILDLSPRLAEIGKIKIGGKSIKKIKSRSGNDWQPPVKFDHIVVTKLTRDAHGNLEKDMDIMKAIGDNTREIPIILLYDEISMNFRTSYAYYTSRSCVCRGDGKNANRMIKNDKNELIETEVTCPGTNCPEVQNKKCKPNGILSAILPMKKKVGGVYKFRTTSWNSVQNILSALAYIAHQTGGKLAGIPLQLEMVTKNTEKHGNVETMNLVYNGVESDLQKAALIETTRREKYKLDIKQYEKKAIESGAVDDNDDPAEIEAEFYVEDKVNTNASRAIEIDASAFVSSANDVKPKVKIGPEKKIDDVL